MVAVLSYITLYSTLAIKQDHSTDSYKFCVFIGSFILKCDAQVETVQQLLEIFWWGWVVKAVLILFLKCFKDKTGP